MSKPVYLTLCKPVSAHQHVYSSMSSRAHLSLTYTAYAKRSIRVPFRSSHVRSSPVPDARAMRRRRRRRRHDSGASGAGTAEGTAGAPAAPAEQILEQVAQST
jgi:hypothetical protein